MKAKVRDTGEIVDVKFATHINQTVDKVHLWCESNQTTYHKSELEFIEDDPESTKSNIDWEKRRYELAKEALNGILASPVLFESYKNNYSFTLAVTRSVEIADMMIKELKGCKE